MSNLNTDNLNNPHHEDPEIQQYLESRGLRSYNITVAQRAALATVRAGDAPLLMGSSGTGKTASATFVAENIGDAPWWLITMMAAKDPQDILQGMPLVKKDQYGNPKFNLAAIDKFADPIGELRDKGYIERDGVQYPGVLFFIDELNRGSTGTLQILFDFIKTCNLPGCPMEDLHAAGKVRVMCAGNPPVGGYTVQKLHKDSAWDRVLVEIPVSKADPRDWLKWAKKAGLHKSVLSFIRNNKDLLHPERAGEKKVPTPASWEKVSHIVASNVKEGFKDYVALEASLAGLLGQDIGRSFAIHVKEGDAGISLTEVLEYDEKVLKENIEITLQEGGTSILSRLVEDLAQHVLNSKVKLSAKLADRVTYFLSIIPKDTQGLFFSSMSIHLSTMDPTQRALAKTRREDLSKKAASGKHGSLYRELTVSIAEIKDA